MQREVEMEREGRYAKYFNILSKLPLKVAVLFTTRYLELLDKYCLLEYLEEYNTSNLGLSTLHINFIIHSILMKRAGGLKKLVMNPDRIIRLLDNYFPMPLSVFKHYILTNIKLYRDLMSQKEYHWIIDTLHYLLEKKPARFFLYTTIKNVSSLLSLIGFRRRIPGIAVFDGLAISYDGSSLDMIVDIFSDTYSLNDTIRENKYFARIDLRPDFLKIVYGPIYRAIQILSRLMYSLKNEIFSEIPFFLRKSFIQYNIFTYQDEPVTLRYLKGDRLEIIFGKKLFKLTRKSTAPEIRSVLALFRDTIVSSISSRYNTDETVNIPTELVYMSYLTRRLLLDLGVPTEYISPLLPIIVDEKPEKYSDYVLYRVKTRTNGMYLEVISTPKGFGWLLNFGKWSEISSIPSNESPAISLLRYRDILNDSAMKSLISRCIDSIKVENLKLFDISHKGHDIMLRGRTGLYFINDYDEYQSLHRVYDIIKDDVKLWIVDTMTGEAKRLRKSIKLSDTGYFIVSIQSSGSFSFAFPVYELLRGNNEYKVAIDALGRPVIIVNGLLILPG